VSEYGLIVAGRIVRMLAVRDEADVLPYNLEWYAGAGFETVAIDNGSTDGSYELCEEARRAGTLVALQRIATERFEWRRLLEALFELAIEQHPDYLMLTGADEFFEVEKGGHLRDAMLEDFAAGYNVLAFPNMEFQMTDGDDPTEPNPLLRMRRYTFRRVGMSRAYPCLPGLDIVTRAGHAPVFPAGVEERISQRYVSRHYPFRTPEQATRKLARMTDLPDGELRPEYVRYSGDPAEFVTKKGRLFPYLDDHDWKHEDRAAGDRLKKTQRALVRLHQQHSELEAEHAALRAAYAELQRHLAER